VLKKRLVGVITVKNGWAVQSFGYRRHLPLGRPEILAENLDRWGADEIILQCIDRSAHQLGPDFALLDRVAKMGLGTPIIFSGGIRTVEEGVRVIQSGADRLGIDALLRDAPEVARALSDRLGAQALIAALPLSMESGRLCWFDYRRHTHASLDEKVVALLREKVVSEALIIDWKNEGHDCGFDFELLKHFPLEDVPLIAFGGLSEASVLRRVLDVRQVAAAAIGNSLNYREQAIGAFKHQLGGLPLRAPSVEIEPN
jgi:imidazole glycerol-phosphate synthase subunit HisF